MEESVCAICGCGLKFDEKNKNIVCPGCGDVIKDVRQIKTFNYEDSEDCPKCGAKLNKIAIGKYECPYCESLFIGEEWYEERKQQEKISNHTRLYKFSGDTDEEALSKFYNCIRNMKGAPSNFKEHSIVKEIMHMYAPFYTYDVDVTGTYTCEVGIEKTVKRYNKEKQRMEDVKETEWFPRSGTINEKICIRVNGFEYDSIVFNSGFKANSSSYFSSVELFCDNYCNGKYSLSNDKKVKFEEENLADIRNVEAISGNIAYIKWGIDRERKKVQNCVSRKYASITRNIKPSYTAEKTNFHVDLVPITLVRYEYDNKQNMIAVMDGVEGKYFSAPTFMTVGKILSIITGIGFSALFTAVPYFLNTVVLKGGIEPHRSDMYEVGFLCTVLMLLVEYNYQKNINSLRTKVIKWIFNIVLIIVFSIVTFGSMNKTSPVITAKLAKKCGIEVQDSSHELLSNFAGSGTWESLESKYDKLKVEEKDGYWQFYSKRNRWGEEDLVQIDEKHALFRQKRTRGEDEFELVFTDEKLILFERRIIRNKIHEEKETDFKIPKEVVNEETTEEVKSADSLDRSYDNSVNHSTLNEHEMLKVYEGTWITDDGWELWCEDTDEGWYFSQERGEGWYESDLTIILPNIAWFEREYEDGVKRFEMTLSEDGEKLSVRLWSMMYDTISEWNYMYTRKN